MRKFGPNIFLYSIFVFYLFSASWGLGQEPVRIRVAVLREKSEAVVAVRGSYEIVDGRTNEPLSRGRNLPGARVSVVPEGLKVRNKVYKTDAFTVTAKKTAGISVNNRPYRGDISFFKDASAQLLVVNTLDLESYVKGVLPQEISPKWPSDAIKAQAVAARTYAVYTKDVMRSKDYDVYADTSSQVYGGYLSEKRKTNRAVNFTAGEVLTYRGKVFPAYFHATCGGTTEDAVELWKIDIPPLGGGRACSFCTDSPHYYWKADFTLQEIQDKLASRYGLKARLQNVSVVERTTTGRIRSLELKDAAGASQVISGKDFRAALGADALRSTNFLISLEEGRVFFKGKGWGHGVGLCQWGAHGMSNKGAGYKEILQFYYPGAEFITLT